MDDDALVLVAGASGGTGREVVEELLSRGLRVRALTTSHDRVESLELQGADEVVVGDLFVKRDAERAVEGCDAVVSAVGSRLGLGMLFQPDRVDAAGVMNLVDAAREAGVEHLSLVSSLGVGDSRDAVPWAFRSVLELFGVLGAKEQGERYLRESGLPYTVFRPGGLTDGRATGDVVVGEGGAGVSGRVSRAELARLLVASLFTPDAADRTFALAARSALRGEPSGVADVDWRLPERVAPIR